MRRFAYQRPKTLAEAARLLEEEGPEARVLAGGTDLVVGLRDDSIQPAVVIDLKWIEDFPHESIVLDGGVLRFSALAPMAEIERDERVLASLPALAEAARVVGSVQIRNRATLAGNICNGSPAADTAPPLLIHGATVVATGTAGERRIPVDDFIIGPRQIDLQRGELVSAIEVPVPEPGFGAAYTRLVRRRGTDLASVTLGDPEAAPEARAAVLEELLAQATPSPRSIRASPDYRLAMLRVLAMRALGVAIERRAGRAA